VYTRAGTTWIPQAYVKASNTGSNDTFSSGLALSGDGSTLAVGAYGEGSGSTGIGGNQADNSAASAGAVYVFSRAGTSWTQQAYLKASNTGAGDLFGVSVALPGDGATLVVGAAGEASAARGIDRDQADNTAPQAGAVYVYRRAGAIWAQSSYIKASNADANDAFYNVELSPDGSTLVVGAFGEDSAATGIDGNQADNAVNGSGAGYVFR